MRQQVLNQFWIVLAGLIVFFLNLGAAGLWDEDEPIYATCAREMLQRNDWVVPTFNGDLFPDKPPLMYWSMIAGYKLFGINEFGARFLSPLAAIGAALATYHLGRRLFSAEVGLWAGLITTTTIIFTVSARAATVDAALTLVTVLAVLCFVEGYLRRQGELGNTGKVASRSVSWLWAIGFWAALGVAVLAKGPIGLLLPAAAIGLFLMLENHRVGRLQFSGTGSVAAIDGDHQEGVFRRRRLSPSATQGGQAPNRATSSPEPKSLAGSEPVPQPPTWQSRLRGLVRCLGPANFLRSLWQMRPLTAVVVVLAVAGPWYVWVTVRSEWAWTVQFFNQFNLRPFTQAIQGHSGPFWYYVPALLIGFFPWSVFLGATIIDHVRQLRRGHPRRAGYVLLACWVGLWFVFWSICRTKLPHYLLPAYPALAMLTACFLTGWLSDPARAKPRQTRGALITAMVVGLGIAVAVPIVARIYIPGEEWLGAVGLIPIVGGAVGLWLLERGRQRAMLTTYAVTSVLFLAALFGVGTVVVDRHQTARPLMAEVDRGGPTEPRVAAFAYMQESMVFYAGRPVAYCADAKELRAFLDRSPRAYVFTLDSRLGELEKQFGDELTVVARRPRFLRRGEVVLLTRVPNSPASRTAGTMSSDRRTK